MPNSLAQIDATSPEKICVALDALIESFNNHPENVKDGNPFKLIAELLPSSMILDEETQKKLSAAISTVISHKLKSLNSKEQEPPFITFTTFSDARENEQNYHHTAQMFYILSLSSHFSRFIFQHPELYQILSNSFQGLYTKLQHTIIPADVGLFVQVRLEEPFLETISTLTYFLKKTMYQRQSSHHSEFLYTYDAMSFFFLSEALTERKKLLTPFTVEELAALTKFFQTINMETKKNTFPDEDRQAEYALNELLEKHPELSELFQEELTTLARQIFAQSPSYNISMSMNVLILIGERFPFKDIPSLIAEFFDKYHRPDHFQNESVVISQNLLFFEVFLARFSRLSENEKQTVLPVVESCVKVVCEKIHRFSTYERNYRYSSHPDEDQRRDKHRISRVIFLFLHMLNKHSRQLTNSFQELGELEKIAVLYALTNGEEYELEHSNQPDNPPTMSLEVIKKLRGDPHRIHLRTLAYLEEIRRDTHIPNANALVDHLRAKGVSEIQAADKEVQLLLEHGEKARDLPMKKIELVEPPEIIPGSTIDPVGDMLPTLGIEVENAPPVKPTGSLDTIPKIYAERVLVKSDTAVIPPTVWSNHLFLGLLEESGVTVDTHNGRTGRDFIEVATDVALDPYTISRDLEYFGRVGFLNVFWTFSVDQGRVTYKTGTTLHTTFGDIEPLDTHDGKPLRIPPELRLARHLVEFTGYLGDLDPFVFSPLVEEITALRKEGKITEAQSLLAQVLDDPIGILLERAANLTDADLAQLFTYYDNARGELEPTSHRHPSRKLKSTSLIPEPSKELYQLRVLQHRHPLLTNWGLRDLSTVTMSMNALIKIRRKLAINQPLYRLDEVGGHLSNESWDDLPTACQEVAEQLVASTEMSLGDKTPSHLQELQTIMIGIGLELGVIGSALERVYPDIGKIDAAWDSHKDDRTDFRTVETNGEVVNVYNDTNFQSTYNDFREHFAAGRGRLPQTRTADSLALTDEKYRKHSPNSQFANRIRAVLLAHVSQPTIRDVFTQWRTQHANSELTSVSILQQQFHSPAQLMQMTFDRAHNRIQQCLSSVRTEFGEDAHQMSLASVDDVEAFTRKWRTMRAERNTYSDSWNYAQKAKILCRDPH